MKDIKLTKERLTTLVYKAICYIEEYGDKENVKKELGITEEEYQEIIEKFDINFC